jgi:hypothetical protein
MAITKNYTTDQGVVCPNAYIVIGNINYTKFPPIVPSVTIPTATAIAQVFFSQANRESDQKPLMTFSVIFNPDMTQNMLEQAYAALKEKPEMSGAVDC